MIHPTTGRVSREPGDTAPGPSYPNQRCPECEAKVLHRYEPPYGETILWQDELTPAIEKAFQGKIELCDYQVDSFGKCMLVRLCYPLDHDQNP